MDITKYLGKQTNVVVDRPLGSRHPKYRFVYKVNYGYVPGTKAPDGEEIDAYVLGVGKPVSKISGTCIAIIHRTNDEDDKLIVTVNNKEFSDAEIEELVEFQEKWFKHIIVRRKIN